MHIPREYKIRTCKKFHPRPNCIEVMTIFWPCGEAVSWKGWYLKQPKYFTIRRYKIWIIVIILNFLCGEEFFFLLMFQFNQVTLRYLYKNYLTIISSSQEVSTGFSQSIFAPPPVICSLISVFSDPPLAGIGPKSWEISGLNDRTIQAHENSRVHFIIRKANPREVFHFTFLCYISNFKTGLPSQEMPRFQMNFSLQKPSSAPVTLTTKLNGFKIKPAHFWPDFHIFQAQRIFHMFECDFKMTCTHFSIRELYQKVTNYNLKHAKSRGITQKWTSEYF